MSTDLLAYMTAIQARVIRNWVRPANAPDDLDCFVSVEQLPNGEIASTTVVQCNGDDTLVRSIEEAITRSSPLPLPADPALFLSSFQFRFTIPNQPAERSGQSE